MALKQAVFTCTADANGNAEDDVRLSSRVGRAAFIDSITFDSSQATRQATDYGLFELDVEGDDDEELEQTQLFATANPDDATVYPRVVAVDSSGLATSAGYGRTRINTQQVRCRVNGGASGDVYTVTLVYETAGDLRF